MMHPFISHIISFLIGAISTGYIFAKIQGIDIRTEGSGNTGATNIARVIGAKAGLVTLVADIAKGVLGAYIGVYICFHLQPLDNNSTEIANYLATHGFAAVLGHCYSPFIGFRGGKGVATSLGVLLVISPSMTAVVLLSFALCFYLTKVVSLASIVAALSSPIAYWLIEDRTPNRVVFFVTVLLSLLVVIRHEKNIRRIVSGEENKFSLAKK